MLKIRGYSLTDETLEQMDELDQGIRSVSFYSLKPGDLVQFVYVVNHRDGTRETSTRFGLVVASRAGPGGWFSSTQDNLLLNVVEAGRLTKDMFSLMVDNLYKNRVACKYSSRILGAFLGLDNFKTFKAAQISSILNIQLIK